MSILFRELNQERMNSLTRSTPCGRKVNDNLRLKKNMISRTPKFKKLKLNILFRFEGRKTFTKRTIRTQVHKKGEQGRKWWKWGLKLTSWEVGAEDKAESNSAALWIALIQDILYLSGKSFFGRAGRKFLKYIFPFFFLSFSSTVNPSNWIEFELNWIDWTRLDLLT